MHKYLLLILAILLNSTFAFGEIKQAPLLKKDSTAQKYSDGSKAFEDLNKPGRSKAAIIKVVMNKVSKLKKIYNKRLVEKPGVKGKIVTKFAIDEFGKVIFCAIVETSTQDSILESKVISEIRSWEFGAIDKPGDVTEVVYPFVFERKKTSAALACVLGLLSLLILIPVIVKQ